MTEVSKFPTCLSGQGKPYKFWPSGYETLIILTVWHLCRECNARVFEQTLSHCGALVAVIREEAIL